MPPTAICGLNRKAQEHQPITHKNAAVKQKRNTATAICGLYRKAQEPQPITHKNANVKQKRNTAICGLYRKAQEPQPITHKNANVKKRTKPKKGQLNTKKSPLSRVSGLLLHLPHFLVFFAVVIQVAGVTDLSCSVLQC